jgi:PIN domain nuclease of toxin-antitoxin system
VRLLLDTHVVLWAATEPAQLASEARRALEDGANEACVSVVTAWEIAIKQSLGKLELPKSAETWLPEVVRRTGFDVIELDLAAALRVRSLPWHHRDPFDRLLVAQALEAGYGLVTRDATLRAYGVAVVQA